LDQRDDIDGELLSEFLVGAITRIIQRLEDELGRLIIVVDKVYK
jgi:hypothetical protein